MKTIKGKTKAWFVPHSIVSGPQDLSGEADRIVPLLGYSSSDSMRGFGWSPIGEAEITVTVPDERTLVDNKVEALRDEKKRLLADAQMKATAIESQIQKLLAITFEA